MIPAAISGATWLTWTGMTGDWFAVENWTNAASPENTRVPAAGDDAVGFVQVGEHKVKLPLLFGPHDCGVQLAGAAGQLGQLAPRFTAAIGNYLVVEPLGQWVLADIAQRNERHPIAVVQELCRQGQNHFFRAAAG